MSLPANLTKTAELRLRLLACRLGVRYEHLTEHVQFSLIVEGPDYIEYDFEALDVEGARLAFSLQQVSTDVG